MDNEGRDSPFSIAERYAAGYYWHVNGGRVDLYAVLCSGRRTPGKGTATTPWVLDDYERVLRLDPIDTWLLKRMLKHAWTIDAQVFISQRQIERQARVTRRTVETHLNKLERLGYIRLASICDPNNPLDRRKRYYVSGIFAALSLCVMADPRSDWAEANGGPVSEEYVRSHAWNGPGYEHDPVQFDLDYDALVHPGREHRPKGTRQSEAWVDDWADDWPDDCAGDGDGQCMQVLDITHAAGPS